MVSYLNVIQLIGRVFIKFRIKDGWGIKGIKGICDGVSLLKLG